MNRKVLLTAFTLGACAVSMALRAQSVETDRDATTWIQTALKEIGTIKVGMTRAQLLLLFETEGGIYTRQQRTYVYRRSGDIKVDVQFEPVGRSTPDSSGRVTLAGSDDDIITAISRPYLAWAVAD